MPGIAPALCMINEFNPEKKEARASERRKLTPIPFNNEPGITTMKVSLATNNNSTADMVINKAARPEKKNFSA